MIFQASLAIPMMDTEEIFRSLGTEQIIRGKKGLMGCRNGPALILRFLLHEKFTSVAFQDYRKIRRNLDEMLN